MYQLNIMTLVWVTCFWKHTSDTSQVGSLGSRSRLQQDREQKLCLLVSAKALARQAVDPVDRWLDAVGWGRFSDWNRLDSMRI